ncbi:MAG: hypothetical protein H0V08_06625 [Thermoleophilaceae bacterium]|nr:hypothetical protein [Thermoleophilaceae bacterium]
MASGGDEPLHFLGEYLRGALPDRPTPEWFTFDEAEEKRLAEYRGRAWATVETQHAQRSGGI